MAVRIQSVDRNSFAAHAGIRPGEMLLSINGHEIEDVLDYRFYEIDEKLSLELLDQTEKPHAVLIRKGQYESIGLEFETYLMDQQHSCRNHCIFCFIDQLPPGMRESLYFKDDDSRLSFLFGNYITLTNLNEHEISRIIAMHISPINISVHTMDPQLRVKMMGNRFAGGALRTLKRFAEANVKINCQLVLCPGINDGAQLERTLRELGKLCPAVQSIAAVPVGLTKYRQGLYPMEPYTPGQAAGVLDIVGRFGDEFLKKFGERIVYAADEFYLCAGRTIPPSEFYGEFSQLENGVGLISNLSQEFHDAMQDFSCPGKARRVTVATGVAASKFIRGLLDELTIKCNNLTCNVVAVTNDFFGHNITVAGLVTGGDIIRQLRGADLGDALLIPSVMLRREGDVFLDDVSVGELSRALRVRVIPVKNDGYELLDAVIGRDEI